MSKRKVDYGPHFSASRANERLNGIKQAKQIINRLWAHIKKTLAKKNRGTFLVAQ